MEFLQENLHITFFHITFCFLLFLPWKGILSIILIKFCFEHLQPDYTAMNIYLCISCPKLWYSSYLLSMLRLECQSRETQVTKHGERNMRERANQQSTSGFPSEKEDYSWVQAAFPTLFETVLKYWAVNWTTTQTSKKTSIIDIDVSSVYLRLICIHIEKPERINCLLLKNTCLLQFTPATKTLPTTRLKNSFLHTGLLFNTEETLQKIQ